MQEMLPSWKAESTTSSRASWDSFNGMKIATNPCFKKGILQLQIKTWDPLLTCKKCLFCALGRENRATAACFFSWDHIPALRGKEAQPANLFSASHSVRCEWQIMCWRLSPVAALLLDRCCEWMWAVRFQQDQTIRVSQAVNFL